MGKALLLGVASALAACNPFGGADAFSCDSDQDCSNQGTSGFCEADKLCSFADIACASGHRYGDLAGGKSNTCVGGDPGDDSGVDMPPDMPPDPQDTCFGDPAGLAKPCFAPTELPTGDIQLTGTLDTTNDGRCSLVAKQIDLAKVCVIAANSIQVPNTNLRVTGSRSLVLVAVTTIQVDGTIDAASHRGNPQLGPAANATTCNAGTAASGGKDGGAGGSYIGLGGTGGGGGGKGVPGAVVPATIAQGGCPGQNGGGAAAGGTKGDGGGVVYLIANGSITVTGTINASGGGATGAVAGGSAGGAGGGSGGLIGFDAPTVTGGTIFANGAGGGQGGTAGGTAGVSADDPTVNSAPGGASASSSAGDGGDGAVGATLTGGNGQNGTAGGGSGGAGGGAGVIKLFRAASINGGQVSPNPS